MKNEILDIILNSYFQDNLGYQTKDTIGRVRNMRIQIYSNDHNPPHFHVISNDNSVNAKFKIEDCEYIGGSITGKQIKLINNFFNDPKVKTLMKMTWSKRYDE